ncbi:MAG TPA: methyltransferase [Caulobacteraceae bacterium]
MSVADAMHAVYGSPPPGLIGPPSGALQVSPLSPGAAALEEIADASLAGMIVAAPPGALERRFVLAHGLRALRVGGELIAVAPKKRGGARLNDELRAFGCEPMETARRHHRIVSCSRPAKMRGLAEAIAAGGPQIAPALGLWSQPGVFSWDRLDPGTALLLEAGHPFRGRGADFGCGVGVLGRAVLENREVTGLILADIDRRAISAAEQNIADSRAQFVHIDLRLAPTRFADLDFVVMNPPFHQVGRRSHSLGQGFIASAADALHAGGLCRIVANASLPYEGALARAFSKVTELGRRAGYKLFEAVK